ncbi:MAG: GIY-YIG nuclease family protein [Holophaga sp.]|jgi:predicted GIY-YIG superfamily endonuclease
MPSRPPRPVPPSPARPWWVYILRCGDGTLYTGIALDLAARLAQHRAGTGARYTRGRGPLELVYREPAPTRAAASRREAAIKRRTRAAKLELIRRVG